MSTNFNIKDAAIKAKESSYTLANMDSNQKNEILKSIANGLLDNMSKILDANKLDIENAQKNKLSIAMQERLLLDEKRVFALVNAVNKVIDLPDPVGNIQTGFTRPNGLEIIKKTVPFGVIGIIYESRPNVTVDTAILCLKSGNVPILRGGREAYFSNKVLVESMRNSLKKSGFDENYIIFVEDTSHETAIEMTQLHGIIDLLIPRGGKNLISMVVNNAKIPVIETGLGNCHLYVEKSADLNMALNILENAKCSRPSVCNAIETLLVDEEIAEQFLISAKNTLDKHNVELRGCEKSKNILPNIILATEEDFYTEYNDYIITVKIVENHDQAINHINKYSTHHSESIITNNLSIANQFVNKIDSAAVYINASTRFTDGEEFGFGAEVGISTQKLHARGPMGLEHLCSTKYIVTGNGQIR